MEDKHSFLLEDWLGSECWINDNKAFSKKFNELDMLKVMFGFVIEPDRYLCT